MTDRPSVLLIHGVSSSRLTWWRLSQDLTDLGWRVQTVDLLGHGERAALGPAQLTVDDIARDVLEQAPGPFELVVGHSLGSVVALTVAGMAPDHAAALIMEDPPGLTGTDGIEGVIARMTLAVEGTRAAPEAAVQAALRENPTWSTVDAVNVVQNRLRLDLGRVTELLRRDPWNLPGLVAACSIPLHLLVATRNSPLVDPDRTAVEQHLGEDRIAVIDSGHDIHRDRPALWLHEILRFATLRSRDCSAAET